MSDEKKDMITTLRGFDLGDHPSDCRVMVRGDFISEIIAHIEELELQIPEAYEHGLRAALGRIASLEYGVNEYEDYGYHIAYLSVEAALKCWEKNRPDRAKKRQG